MPRAGKQANKNWNRVQQQLQVQLGADVFNSWFGRLKMDSIGGGVVVHTVPTAFLKSWILNHYREKLLELWQKEDKSVLRVDVTTRSAVRKTHC